MDPTIELQGEVWMSVGGTALGGEKRIALLEAILACGSIAAAARTVGMSYKGAWDAVDAMNNLSGEPLVARASGGKGGGGTRLTARGAQLVHSFRAIERAHRRFVAELGRDAGADLNLLRRLTMKTTARNHFLGTVTAVRRGAVNDEIELALPSGEALVAIVTHESTGELGLRVGAEAVALVKDSSIIVLADEDRARYSARNRLAGTIVRLQPGAVNTELVLDLGHGSTLAATITNQSCAALDLAEGKRAAGMFKASAVILCVPG
jgi:molybdate transport system regulatory protein